MPTLNADVDANQFVSRHYEGVSPETLRQSEARRTRLARWAQVVGHEDAQLALNPSHGETARVQFNEDVPQIAIPAWEIPQPVTDLDREAYDFLMQRTMTLHEVGHIRYTDQNALEAAVEAVAPGRREQFHSVWNALEDGAIENQLRGDFSVTDEIQVMNANYMGSHGGAKTYDILDAIQRACLDLAVYDTGDLRALLDENEQRLSFTNETARETFCDDILPDLEQVIPDIVTEPDPVQRTQQIKDLWDALEQYIDPDTEPDNPDLSGKGDHTTQDNGHGEHADQLDAVNTQDAADRIGWVLNGNADTDSGTDPTDNENQEQATEEEGGSNALTSSSDSVTNTETEGARGQESTSPELDGRSGDDHDQNNSGESRNNSSHSPGEHTESGDDGDSVTSDSSSQGGQRSAQANSTDSYDDDTRDSNSGSEEQSGLASSQSESAPAEQVDGESNTRSETVNNLDSEELETGTPRDEQISTADTSGDTAAGETAGQAPLNTTDIGVDPDPEPALEQDYLDRVSEEVIQQEENLDALEDEVRAFADVLERLEERGEDPSELELPGGNEIRQSAWESTRRHGTQLQQILEDQLQQEQRSNWRRGRARGQVDTRSLPRIARSDPRVFRQRDSPDEKDYSAAIVLDRSGSMDSDIHHAEESAVALAFALEELDIETCVIDMYRSRPRLAKPYGSPVQSNLDSLLTGETGGETPLSKALRLARERVTDRDETPFCIVVTDGQPDNQDAYMDELRKTQFPVLGVYLALNSTGPNSVPTSVQESASLFDQRQVVTNADRLLPSLRGLCREVMF